MRRSSNKLSGLLWGMAWSFLLISSAQAAEFSADIVNQSGGQERQGKIYVKGENMRQEFATPGGATVTIMRGDKKVMWMLMPGQQAYMEMPFDKEAFAKNMNIPKDEASQKLVGRETLKGYDTEKYETSVKTGTGEVQGTIWIAKKLGVPIRIETKDKSFVQEYNEIKDGGVADAIFEVPAGYKKMNLPQGMPKMK